MLTLADACPCVRAGLLPAVSPRPSGVARAVLQASCVRIAARGQRPRHTRAAGLGRKEKENRKVRTTVQNPWRRCHRFASPSPIAGVSGLMLALEAIAERGRGMAGEWRRLCRGGWQRCHADGTPGAAKASSCAALVLEGQVGAEAVRVLAQLGAVDLRQTEGEWREDGRRTDVRCDEKHKKKTARPTAEAAAGSRLHC